MLYYYVNKVTKNIQTHPNKTHRVGKKNRNLLQAHKKHGSIFIVSQPQTSTINLTVIIFLDQQS